MNKKILSIDFDIIMHLSINLYNIYVEEADDPEELWKELEEEYEYEKYNLLKYDKEVLINIIKLLKANLNKPIHFIQNHEEIVDLLKETENYENTQYDIYNIDFHHDIWYNKQDFYYINKHDEYNCANWIGYLFLKKKLSSITWLKAPKSISPNFASYELKNKLTELTLKNFNQLKDIDFDEVYFCLSPQWIPPRYRIFYQIIKELLEKE